MKLSEYAEKVGVTYQTAWNWWKLGHLNAEQLPSGTIIVHDDPQIRVGTSGCFDILHCGHVFYLEKSKKLGDHLTVLLNTDKWIKENKREPIYNEQHRKYILESLGCVDKVILFNTDEEKDDLLYQVQFDIWTKAAKPRDYTDKHSLLETPTIESYGGKVVIVKTEYPECSTTNTIEKISKIRND